MTDTTSLRREKLAFSIAEVMEVHIAIGPTTTADKAVEIFELLGPIFADLARVTAERDAERAVADELRDAASQARLGFAGYVSARSAVDMLDDALAAYAKHKEVRG